MAFLGKLDVGGGYIPVTTTLYGVCDTAADVAAKVVTCDSVDQFKNGFRIAVLFTNGNSVTSNVTLNISNIGALSISNIRTIAAGELIDLIYINNVFYIVTNTPTKVSDLTNDSGYITSSGNCSNASNNLNSYQVDLRDTSIYSENTWYPVTFLYNGGGSNEFYQIGVRATLGGSGTPSWATHSNGFSCAIDLLVTDSGWGSLPRADMQLRNVFDFVSDGKNPVGYIQLTSSSTQVFYLRGGGNYYITSKSGIKSITVRTESYTRYDQTVAPTTTYPGIQLGKTTIDAYINGYIPTSSISGSNGVCRHYSIKDTSQPTPTIDWAKVRLKSMHDNAYPEFYKASSIIVTLETNNGDATAIVSCNGVDYFKALVYSYYWEQIFSIRYSAGSWQTIQFTGTFV